MAKVITIQVRDPQKVAKEQGGEVAALASRFSPEYVEDQVYTKMAAQMGDALKAKGVVADVQVLNQSPAGTPMPSSRIMFGIGVGAGITGLMWLASKLLFKRR
jgi:hypothetical protein